RAAHRQRVGDQRVADRARGAAGSAGAISRGPGGGGHAPAGAGGGMSALAADLAAALDPVVFAEQTGLVPDAWQADVLRSRATRLLLNCSRQVGKSTVTAVLALHTALYEAPALGLLLSPSLRQSQELFAKVLVAYRRLGRPVSPEPENKLSLELENGSRVL